MMLHCYIVDTSIGLRLSEDTNASYIPIFFSCYRLSRLQQFRQGIKRDFLKGWYQCNQKRNTFRYGGSSSRRHKKFYVSCWVKLDLEREREKLAEMKKILWNMVWCCLQLDGGRTCLARRSSFLFFTLQKKEVCAQRNVPAKRFKICYILCIRKST